jgi:hypothetical protein
MRTEEQADRRIALKAKNPAAAGYLPILKTLLLLPAADDFENLAVADRNRNR